MGTGIDPTVDYAFKRVFGSEESRDILRDLLNAVLESSGVRPVSEVEILNPFSMKDALDDRLSIVDIKARDDLARESLIEMQMLAHKAFRERLLYYLAKDYSQMLSESEDFTKLKPVIVVCFINDVLCPEVAGYHSYYELLDPETHIRFTDHWAVHVIEVPKFDKSLAELTTDLDRWAYFLKHGPELDPATLPSELQVSGIVRATGVLRAMSQNTTDRDLYEARLKYQRDQSCYIATAREQGLEQGELRGRVAMHDMILRIGTKRLGPPPGDVAAALQSIVSLEQLQRLGDHILDCANWNALLEDA